MEKQTTQEVLTTRLDITFRDATGFNSNGTVEIEKDVQYEHAVRDFHFFGGVWLFVEGEKLFVPWHSILSIKPSAQ